MILHRVFPYDPSAAPTERGGALYMPSSSGAGRIDNPGAYTVIYLAESAEAAAAETFGPLPVWRSQTFVHAGTGLPYAMASYALPESAPLLDLNDVTALASLGVARPSDIMTRNREVTHAWALKIFHLQRHVGIRWWSYYQPDWMVCGLWNIEQLRLLEKPKMIGIASSPVVSAAIAIVRQIVE